MAEKFKPGDFVQLKSGGPLMTVERVYQDTIHCQWFSGPKLNEGSFNVNTLVRGKKPSEEESEQGSAKR